MNLLKRLRRGLARHRVTKRLSVRTRNSLGQAFHYDIRVCPARSCRSLRLRFLVRFDRTGPQGNSIREYRVMNRDEVTRLLHASA